MSTFNQLYGGCCMDSILVGDPVAREVYCGACGRKISRKKARWFMHAWKKIFEFLNEKKEKKPA